MRLSISHVVAVTVTLGEQVTPTHVPDSKSWAALEAPHARRARSAVMQARQTQVCAQIRPRTRVDDMKNLCSRSPADQSPTSCVVTSIFTTRQSTKRSAAAPSCPNPERAPPPHPNLPPPSFLPLRDERLLAAGQLARSSSPSSSSCLSWKWSLHVDRSGDSVVICAQRHLTSGLCHGGVSDRDKRHAARHSNRSRPRPRPRATRRPSTPPSSPLRPLALPTHPLLRETVVASCLRARPFPRHRWLNALVSGPSHPGL